MGLISYTLIQNGTSPDASQVNTPLTTIYDEFNGNISAANLASNSVTTAKIADASVTNAKLATGTGELGGAWQSWSPILSGFSGTPTVTVARYKQIGKTVTISMRVEGTSNANTKTITPPVAPKDLGQTVIVGFAATNDSGDKFGAVGAKTDGTLQVFRGMDNAGGTIFTTWSTSGTVSYNFTVTYEAA